MKREIARKIYGDEPEVMAELARDYETEALHQLARDSRFQSFKEQEAAQIDSIVRATPPGPERDDAIAAASAGLHRRIFGGPAP